MRFRKKPVEIEAFQMTPERRQDNSEWPSWLHQAWSTPHDDPGAVFPSKYPESDGTDPLMIHTIGGGRCLIEWGDWIIRGVNGELYPCKPDVFEKTYESVEPSDAVPRELVEELDRIFIDVPGVNTVELGGLMSDMCKGRHRE